MWYSVRMLFESHVEDSRKDTRLCDDVVKLVQAASADDASTKARTIATADESTFSNDDGATVQWRFIHILDVQDLCEETLFDGLEVYSRLFWKADETK